MRSWIALAATVTSLLALPAYSLDLGDAAPALSVASWAKGDPVSLDSGKGIYVVEFWATWCKPCRENIPHMTDLQERFKGKGVTVVAVSDEDQATVQEFVDGYGKKMGYTVAVDNDRATNEAYGRLPGFRGIPFSVVIDAKGQIAWFGHPMAGLDQVLEDMVAGTYDIAATKKARDAQKLYPKYFHTLATGDDAAAKLIGEQILTDCAKDSDFLNEFAWTILTDSHVKTRDLALATRVAKAAYDNYLGGNSAITDTYARALFDSGDVAGAITYQKKAIATCTDQALLLDLQDTLARYQAAHK